MSRVQSLRLLDLNKLDRLELERSMPKGSITFEAEQLDGARHGDISLLLALVSLGGPALAGLSVWLAKDRRKGKIRRSIWTISADGSERREELEIDVSSSTAPERAVLDGIARMEGVSADAVADAARILQAGMPSQ